MYTVKIRPQYPELFDITGSFSTGYEYSPFDMITVFSGSAVVHNPLTFSSEVDDDRLGLTYYNYRHLNRPTGRWLGRDGIGELGGLNLYIFVNNRSLDETDFLGLSFTDWIPYYNTFLTIIGGVLQGIPGQHPYDYPGAVGRDTCCKYPELAEQMCEKSNNDMFSLYIKDANEGSIKTKATDVAMTFLSGILPPLAIAGFVDAILGLGGALGVSVDMASAMKAANAENCDCRKYLN